MRIAYIECFSGISGDMLLGALLDAGIPEELFHRTVAGLKLGAELRIRRVDRSGISATKVDVLVDGKLAEGAQHSHHSHAVNESQHSHTHTHEHPHSHHDHGDTAADHQPMRSLTEIRTILENAELPAAAREMALRTFELLGEAESNVHNVPIESVHFHEVGAVDTIVDVACAAVGCHALRVEQFICSRLNVGGGSVRCAHGEFPVPAPATLALLKHMPLYSSGIKGELVTPTGAALLQALRCSFSGFPSMKVQSIGYGAGTREFDGLPNVLRISVGELVNASEPISPVDAGVEITVLETTIDDSSPQVLGYVTQRLLSAGALDAFVTAVQMKKNRPGSLLTVLCKHEAAAGLRDILFSETSTIGIRSRRERRYCLDRANIPISTQWGTVQIKESRLHGKVASFAPEYEDCRRIAEAHSVPLKQVQQETIAAYVGLSRSLSSESGQSDHAPVETHHVF